MNISTFQSNLDFIKSLYFHEEWKDEKCRDDILEAIEEANLHRNDTSRRVLRHKERLDYKTLHNHGKTKKEPNP